ncbi:hypothetical protein LXL04_005009 [Taraxacum kok-saghyz]
MEEAALGWVNGLQCYPLDRFKNQKFMVLLIIKIWRNWLRVFEEFGERGEFGEFDYSFCQLLIGDMTIGVDESAHKMFDEITFNAKALLLLSTGKDAWRWELDALGVFTVGSLRRSLDDDRLALDRLPMRLNLVNRGIDISSSNCLICDDNIESVRRVFFDCETSKQVWKHIAVWLDLQLPEFSSLEVAYRWVEALHVRQHQKQMVSECTGVPHKYKIGARDRKIWIQNPMNL